MKLKLRAAALLLAAAMVTGCGGNTDTAVTTDAAANVNTTAETEQEIDYSALSDEEIRQLMVERSLMTVGNTARMEKALAKAAEGKEITVAYIGGTYRRSGPLLGKTQLQLALRAVSRGENQLHQRRNERHSVNAWTYPLRQGRYR